MTGRLHKIIYLSPDEIQPNPKNPRKHNRAQRRALAKSIQKFGFNAPILVDKNKMILAGHCRWEVAKEQGIPKVPVICLDELSDREAQAYMLADNKLCDRSSWDDALLAGHLKELSELTVEFDLECTGFEVPEIDLRVLSLADDQPDMVDDFNLPTGSPVTQLGDIWFLGDHVICCGSATEAQTYEAFSEEIQVGAVVADPPYNVRIIGNVSGLGKTKHREFVEGVGEKTKGEFTAFLAEAMSLAKIRSAPGAVHFWCMDWRHIQELQDAGQASGLELLNLCVWVKTNGGMGSFYRSRHELVFVYRNGPDAHRNNVQLGRFGRNRTNVWHYPGANSRSGTSALQYHPTPKPIDLVADAIQDCTDRGDYVLDPFLGSGTTMLAAERTGRRCIGIELDPIYVDVAIERWQRLTRREARLREGQTFADAKSGRAAV